MSKECLIPTLADLATNPRCSVTGYDMECVVKTALNSIDEEEVIIARELMEKYFSGDVDDNYKPLKFVHYRVLRTEDGEYTLRRNLYMSPRAVGYFSTEDETSDEIRQLIRSKTSILGADLKRIVAEVIEREYEFPSRDSSQEEVACISYSNLSKQLAQYISDFFINCEKPIRDDVWYGVACKEYATATIYRDMVKSPRPQYNKNM